MKKLLVITAILLFAGVSFSQSLQKDGIVSIHEWTVKLNPDVTMNQFLKMWEETIIPVIKSAIPEMKPLVIKGVGDDNKFEYAGLYTWDSLDELRKYFNADGSYTDLGVAGTEKIIKMMSEVEKFGEFTYTAKDYIIK
jgi:hypothetical protein